MIVEIVEGRDIIDILCDGFATYLKVCNPIAVDCWDCHGSAGKYYCFTNSHSSAIKFNNILAEGDEEQVYSEMITFLQLFNSGKYDITILNDAYGVELHYDSVEVKPNTFTLGYYNPNGSNLVFTQSQKSINIDRVKYYEQLIRKGFKPKAVVFSATFQSQGTYDEGSQWQYVEDSPMFVLDGHHKLLAYNNLGIPPVIVHIHKQSQLSKNASILADAYYFISNYLKDHIINNNPAIYVDKTPRSLHYNRLLDDFLSTSEQISYYFSVLILEASKSYSIELNSWLDQKIEVLKSRQGSKFQLYYWDKDNNNNSGTWCPIEISSSKDIDKWYSMLVASNAVKNF